MPPLPVPAATGVFSSMLPSSSRHNEAGSYLRSFKSPHSLPTKSIRAVSTTEAPYSPMGDHPQLGPGRSVVR
eukprot:scaffold76796_cov32-Tisochrysis_lutea.AAC.4